MGKMQSSKSFIKEEEMISEPPSKQIYLSKSTIMNSPPSSQSISNSNNVLKNDKFKINNKNGTISKLNEREASAISFNNKIIGETIVKVEISESEEKNTSEFIIILDISESMGNYVSQILNNIIPKVLIFLNLAYHF